MPYNLSPVTDVIKTMTGVLWSGVDLFFVLSGFLLGSILLKNFKSKNYFKTFYLRRFLRIYPLYIVLLLSFVIINLLIDDKSIWLLKGDIPLWSYFVFLQNFYMGSLDTFGAQALTPTRSLAVEEQFYILLPFIIYVSNKKYLPFILGGLIIIAPVFRSMAANWHQGYVLFPMRMDSMLLGVFLAYLTNETRVLHFFIKHFRYLVLAFFVVVLLGVLVNIQFKLGVLNHTWMAIMFALIILILLAKNDSIFSKICKFKILIQFGQLSYSIYIFHQIISGLAHYYINDAKPQMQNWTDLIITISALIITFVLAKIANIFIEKPLISIGRKYDY